MAPKKTFEFFFGPLLKKFFQDMGRDPNNLEIILLRQKAGQLLKDSNKIIDFPQKESFMKQVELMKRSGDIADPNNLKKNDNVLTREMFQNSNLNKVALDRDRAIKAKARIEEKNKEAVTIKSGVSNSQLNKNKAIDQGLEIEPINEKFIQFTIQDIKKKEPVEGMKIANQIIKREGDFVDLTEEQSKKILTEVNDHIMGVDLPIGPEDLAKGGRAGFYTGGITDVEPSLDDIGHGSDALMARTRLMSPGAQATTSTGLNYLLAEDNDNMRIPFAGGGGGRRAFLKMLGLTGAGIAGLKTGMVGLGEGGAKKAVTETVKQSAGSGMPPPYFFKLVEKIKTMGDDVTEKAATQEREIVKRYKDFEMTEDIGTGNIVIKKRNEGSFYDQDGIISDEYIVYKPGQVDELTKGKKPPPEYDEYTVRPDGEGKLRDSEDGLDSIDEILEEVGETVTKKADGGRIGFKVGGSGKKFIEKIFGKGSLDVMKSRDPELHKGMLEVVEMFRNRDKEGLKMYLQKFLPHMDDETIEAFIVGDAADAAGQGKYGLDNIQGQLIRLGSGRDYAGKIKMVKDAENMRALDKLDVTDRKPNASGGLQTMLGE